MTAISAANAITRRSFAEVWLITLGHTMTHWYPATFYLLLPLIGNELGHLSDRMGRRRIIMSSMAMTAIVLLLMATVGRSTTFVLFISFLGFFLFAIRAVMQAWMLDATPQNMGGTSIGSLFGTQEIGAAIGPALGGILADRYGLIATFYFLALTIIIANFLIFFTPTKAGVN